MKVKAFIWLLTRQVTPLVEKNDLFTNSVINYNQIL